MAGADRMTIEEVVKDVLVREHGDLVRAAVEAVCRELMDVEVTQLIGAEHGERTPDRATHRNGYRPREWQTRAGTVELQIPKLRRGSYFPSFLEPRRRSEQALLAVIQQCYVCGVSTRRVDQLVESLGLRVSKSEVSRVCGALDEHVEAFRTRPLEGAYPYVFLDAKVEKVRDGGRVVTKALVVAHGGVDLVSWTPDRLRRLAREKGCPSCRDTVRRKRQAVELIRSGTPLKQAAEDLGVSEPTLRSWLRQGDIDSARTEGLTTDEREELRRLRRENRRLQQEREILKAAAAFFARETDRR